MPVPTKTAVIDPSLLFRQALVRLLDGSGFLVVRQGADCDDIDDPDSADEMPALILVDPRTAAASRTDWLSDLRARFPSVRIVVLTEQWDKRLFGALLSAEVDGYLLKSMTGEALIAWLGLVMTGHKAVSGDLIAATGGSSRQIPIGRAEILSARERQVLHGLMQGKTSKAIGGSLGISEKTVRVHIHRVLRRLHLANRNEAVLWAVSAGLGSQPSQAMQMLASVAAEVPRAALS